MQGIILTGGKGSRLKPLTNDTNKHLLDLCGKPMIHYSLSILASAGIKDITLISNTHHIDKFENLLSDNFDSSFDIIRFVAQTDDKPGIAGSIQTMPPEVRRGPYMLVLADNIIGGSAYDFRCRYEEEPDSALILLTEVQSSSEFGVAHFEKGKLTAIEEKPHDMASHWAITGIYFFPEDLFEHAERVEPSWRGEYEVTDILSQYLGKKRLRYEMLPYWWIDAGTHESLARARKLIEGKLYAGKFDSDPE